MQNTSQVLLVSCLILTDRSLDKTRVAVCNEYQPSEPLRSYGFLVEMEKEIFYRWFSLQENLQITIEGERCNCCRNSNYRDKFF